MTDSFTRRRICVSNDGEGGPYIMLPVEQLEQIESLLRSMQVPFWVDSNAISVNGRPEFTVINLRRGADVHTVQHLLDQVE